MFGQPWYIKKMQAPKKTLIDLTFKNPQKRSFIDLGGVWNVDAAYTFYVMDKYKPDFGFLVDGEFTDNVIKNAEKYPNLTLNNGFFGEESVISQLKKVDVPFFV
jgi:hypothetical protein